MTDGITEKYHQQWSFGWALKYSGFASQNIENTDFECPVFVRYFLFAFL